MGDTVRLRVVFKDAAILRSSQRRQGLQRCWLQLRPDIVTIADLAAHLNATFGLHSSCPHGLIISMDGFVLPAFESTCILKDEDIIMIKRNGVMFQDIVKFRGSQNQEQVLQSRHISASNNRNLEILDPQVDSQEDKNDAFLINKSTVHNEIPNKKMNEHCKRKRYNKFQGSNNTLAIKDSQGDSPGDEENVSLHGNRAYKESASNEMVNPKCKKKRSNELQTSDSLANKDSQADLQVEIEKGDLSFPIPHKETSSSVMIKVKLNRKRKHFDKLQDLDDTLAIKDSQRNLHREEEDHGLHGNIAHMEATSTEMLDAKYKKKHSNKLQAYPLTITNSQGDPQVDGDLWLPDGKTTRKETSCEMKNAKHKGKCSNKHQGSDDTLVIKDSQGYSKCDEENFGLHGNIVSLRSTSNEMLKAKSKKSHSNSHHTSDNTLAVRDSQGDKKEAGLPNGNIAPMETPIEITNVIKRKHSNKLQASENESMGKDDGLVSENDGNGDARKALSTASVHTNLLIIFGYCWNQGIPLLAPDQVPSRSARRKKAKRIWYHTFGSKKEKKLIEIETAEGDNQKKIEHANADQHTDVDTKIAPVIVRPGHIRFESSDTYSVRADEPVETFQWNGTTSKKKGQKWGRENTFKKYNDDTSSRLSRRESSNRNAELVDVSIEKSAVEKVDSYEECIVNQVELVNDCNENSVTKESKTVTELIEFESLSPLVRLPEEGDVLVYRLVELSSSWCPELSTFRVGRVSSYDCISSKVILLPLPEYPLILEEISEEGQVSTSLYKEDGTLEIDFASLVDVRLFKASESVKTTPSTTIGEMQNAASVNNQESASCSSNGVAISSNHTVNDQLCEGWETINQALNERKSQLHKQNGLDERNSSSKATATTGAWSYRVLRRNALGPTLAMLRSSNGDSGK